MRQLLVSVYRWAARTFLGSGLSKFYPVRRFGEVLFSLVRSDFVEVDGHTLHLDAHDSLKLSLYGFFELAETEAIVDVIRPGDVVLDVGAHIGYYTLLFARLVGPEGKVFAFEPEPNNFKLLEENVRRNGYTNVVLEQKAVLDLTGKTQLNLSEIDTTGHRVQTTDDPRRSITVDAVRLDDYFRTYDGRIDCVKMDIQGAEFRAVSGMTELFQGQPSLVLFMEYWPFGLRQSSSDPAELLAILERAGYYFCDVRADRRVVRERTVADLLSMYSYDEDDYTNLLCRRRV